MRGRDNGRPPSVGVEGTRHQQPLGSQTGGKRGGEDEGKEEGEGRGRRRTREVEGGKEGC